MRFCPHCGNDSKQKEVYSHKYARWHDDAGDAGPIEIDYEYNILVCQTCDEVLVYHRVEYDEDYTGDLVWPTIGALSPIVPAPVREAYLEATRIKDKSPNGAAALLRKALERACKDRAAEGRTLHERIESLAKRGEFPPAILKATHLIRSFGNQGLHDEDDVSPEEVKAMKEFFETAMHYLYVLPAELARFEKDMSEAETRG